jgi:hypothetical protein
VDAGDQLVLVERLGQIVVGAEAETLHLVLDAGEAGEDQDRGFDLGDAQRAQNLVAGHVRQVQVEQDDVVVIELAEIDALFAEVGRIDVEASDLSISSMLCAVALSSSIRRTRIRLISGGCWRSRSQACSPSWAFAASAPTVNKGLTPPFRRPMAEIPCFRVTIRKPPCGIVRLSRGKVWPMGRVATVVAEFCV